MGEKEKYVLLFNLWRVAADHKKCISLWAKVQNRFLPKAERFFYSTHYTLLIGLGDQNCYQSLALDLA
jgi:hypothetical protein